MKPIPTIPFSTLGPSSAIQSPLRIDNAGRRDAEGLFGCVAQYGVHFFQRHSSWIGPIEGIFKHPFTDANSLLRAVRLLKRVENKAELTTEEQMSAFHALGYFQGFLNSSNLWEKLDRAVHFSSHGG